MRFVSMRWKSFLFYAFFLQRVQTQSGGYLLEFLTRIWQVIASQNDTSQHSLVMPRVAWMRWTPEDLFPEDNSDVLTVWLPRVINFKFPQKHNITQDKELGFHTTYSDQRWLYDQFSLHQLYIFSLKVGEDVLLNFSSYLNFRKNTWAKWSCS